MSSRDHLYQIADTRMREEKGRQSNRKMHPTAPQPLPVSLVPGTETLPHLWQARVIQRSLQCPFSQAALNFLVSFLLPIGFAAKIAYVQLCD